MPDRAINPTDTSDRRSRVEISVAKLRHGCPLPNKVVFGRKFNEWVIGMVQLWIIFDHCEEPWEALFTASPAPSRNIKLKHINSTS